MGKIHFTLKDTIKRLNTTPNRIAVEAKVRPPTVYNMVENKTSRVSMDTLADIIDALNVIAEERGIQEEFDVEDVFIYKKR